MKIIIIGPAHPLRGGIADTNTALCRALAAEHDASIISFTLQYPKFLFPGKTQRTADPPPKDVSIRPLINSVNPLNWITTARKINAMEPDMVIVRYWIPFLAPCLGTIARRLKKHIILVALCDNIIPHEKRFGDRMLTQYFTTPFHGFITMSGSVRHELQDFTDKPAITIPHPINDDLEKPVSKEAARTYLKLDPSGKYILFFGLIRKYKGLDLLLEAMGDKRLQDIKLSLLIAGEFYDPPDTYLDSIDKHGLKDRVIIRDEYIPASELKYYFSAADLVTQTYRSASQSGVTQIAFNFDRPILVTDVGGLSEVVAHGETGYVSSKTPEAIANYIFDFYHNKREADFVTAIQKEKPKYSWKSFAKTLTDFYAGINQNEE